MFVISMKSDKLKKYLIIFCACIITIIGGIISVSNNKAAPVSVISGINMSAGTAEERQAFFSAIGREIDPEPLEVKEIVIPSEFDETYEEYNSLQKRQGLSLEKYKGKRVKMWSYKITDYPGYETSDAIRGNLLVYDGVIIGGDISCIELGGFMHGLIADTAD